MELLRQFGLTLIDSAVVDLQLEHRTGYRSLFPLGKAQLMALNSLLYVELSASVYFIPVLDYVGVEKRKCMLKID